jgi:hypothetical protein
VSSVLCSCANRNIARSPGLSKYREKHLAFTSQAQTQKTVATVCLPIVWLVACLAHTVDHFSLPVGGPTLHCPCSAYGSMIPPLGGPTLLYSAGLRLNCPRSGTWTACCCCCCCCSPSPKSGPAGNCLPCTCSNCMCVCVCSGHAHTRCSLAHE